MTKLRALSGSQKPYLCRSAAFPCSPNVLKTSSPLPIALTTSMVRNSSAPATLGSGSGAAASPEASPEASSESSDELSSSGPVTCTCSPSVRWLNMSATGTMPSPCSLVTRNARLLTRDAAALNLEKLWSSGANRAGCLSTSGLRCCSKSCRISVSSVSTMSSSSVPSRSSRSTSSHRHGIGSAAGRMRRYGHQRDASPRARSCMTAKTRARVPPMSSSSSSVAHAVVRAVRHSSVGIRATASPTRRSRSARTP